MRDTSLRLILLFGICLAVGAGPSHTGPAGYPPGLARSARAAQAGGVSGYPVAWGDNSSGELGDGICCAASSVPVLTSGLTQVVAMAGGNGYSMALRSDGTVWEWGCCDEHSQPLLRPVRVSGVAGVIALAAGARQRLALERDGTVWTWGAGRKIPVQVSGLSSVTVIAAGAFFYLALRSDGTVWAWGLNDHGQLGNGHGGATPGEVVRVPAAVRGLSGVTRIAAGEQFALALERNGTVWSWGSNINGVLGRALDPSLPCPEYVVDRGRPACSAIPGRVSGLTGVTALAAGGYHSLAIRSDGTLWVWGGNGDGALGIGTLADTPTCGDGKLPCSTPVPVQGFSGVVSVAAGRFHTLALKRDGTVWAWGFNNNGRVGTRSTSIKGCGCIDRPVRVQGLGSAIAVAAGWGHSLALLRALIPAPKRLPCAGSPKLGGGNRFPRTVRLHAPQAIAVSERTGHIFVASGGGYDCEPSVTMLDAGSGAPLRVVPVNQDPYGAEPYAVLVADQLGRVFVISRGNPTFERKDGVTVLDAKSGRLLYTTTVPAGSQAMAVDQRTWRAFILQVGQAGPGGPLDVVSLSTLAVTRGVVLRTVSVGHTLNVLKLALEEQTGRLFVLDDELFMVDARDGRLLGRVRTSGTSRPSDLAAVETTRRLFVLSGRQECGPGTGTASSCRNVGVLDVLDAGTGAIVRSVDHVYGELVADERAGAVLALPPVAEGQVWGGTVLDARDGRIVHRLGRLGYGPLSARLSAVDGHTGSIYLYAGFGPTKTRGGGIVELDPKRGRIVRSMPLAHTPSSLAVAERARRVLVADQEANSLTIFQASP